ncbi:transcriptional regulator [Bisbaumannia pacifica]|uniref:Transcriptional regulator n=1 Tax=Bisbaumannia pacifica TaxID=77098 RepID=A0A510XAS1_9GAMM|nr:GntR family transcriptional regulator [Halomonas pacifica]GEK48524.1 transcriptional regulator [Halomonas pacifica]
MTEMPTLRRPRPAADEASPGAPLRRLSLYQVVAERLRHMVLEGELAAGSRISEKRLCEAFEVSRTPLREALKVLANEGLVELLPNRGAQVTAVDPAEVHDLFEVMAALEGLSGHLLVERASDAEIAEIRALHARMLELHRRQRRQEYFEANQRLHRRLTEIAGNRVLLEQQGQLTHKITRARYAANLQQGRWDESAQEHGVILAALEARDAAALSAAMVEHMRRTGAAVLDGLTASRR